MSKQALLYVSIAAIALAVVGSVLTNSGTSAGTIVSGLGGLGALAAWIGGLIKTIQLKRWGWFVAVLLLAPITTLLYGIYGPAAPRA